MSSEVMAAVIGASGAVVVVIVDRIVGAFWHKREEKSRQQELKKQQSLQYITDKRSEWDSKVKEELAFFIAKAMQIAEEYILTEQYDAVPAEESFKLYNSVARLRLYFNISGELDQKILKAVLYMDNILAKPDVFNAQEFVDTIEKLTKYAQVYFKLEWERIKLEVQQELSKDEIAKQLDKMQERLTHNYV